VTLLALLLACAEPDAPSTDTRPTLEGPALVHVAPAAARAGEPLSLDVEVSDPDGVATVALYHRRGGESQWNLLPMTPADGGHYAATVDGADVMAPSLEYYVRAEDAGAVPARAYLPEDSVDAPFVVPVTVQGVALPFVEDFERPNGEVALREIGWASAALGFRGNGWVLDSEAHAGDGSVAHPRVTTAAGAVEDWLIGPVLDLSAVADAQVTWWERIRNGADADHALWASTDSRDPERGTWVPVAEQLPSPADGAWTPSPVVDLSAFVGATNVALAWVVRGSATEDWWLDDVRVETRQPVLAAEVREVPDGVMPGGTGTLRVSVSNESDLDAEGVTVALAFPGVDVTVEGGTDALALPAGETTDVAFTLRVGADVPVPRNLDGIVTVTRGDHVREIGTRVRVGPPAVARVVFAPSGTGNVEVVLGAGSPDAPDWQVVLHDAPADAALDLSSDVTDQHALLPPRRDGTRWFVAVTSDAGGALTSFGIDWLGETLSASVLPPVAPRTTTVAWLPSPVSYTASVATDPATLTPGAAGVSVALSVSNEGADGPGPLVVRWESRDPALQVREPSTVTLDADGLGHGEGVSLDGAFVLDVSADHVDGTDLLADLVLDDGESETRIPVRLAVPWPSPQVHSVRIDDDGGDGILDPGEHAELEVRLVNAGTLALSASLDATLALAAGSVVTGELDTSEETYPSLAVGQAAWPSDPWDITVSGGAPGEVLDLRVTVTDGTRSWTLPVPVTLGEPPWQPFATPDARGDVVSPGTVDLRSGRWRVRAGALEIELDTAAPLRMQDLFVEAWATALGSQWSYHRLVIQSGTAVAQGYGSTGFVELARPAVVAVDADTVRVTLVLADLDIPANQLSIGFAAGWCGPPTYFCDHYPDGWGYAYTWDFFPSRFLNWTW
jgi:hypothetical protein